MLTSVHRSAAEQMALYAQGRRTLAEVNVLRRIAGLPNIGAAEAAKRVTNAPSGSSPHNYLPALAFDVAFRRENGTLDWSLIHFQRFAPYVTKHAEVEWGGSWATFKDNPHFQLKNWRKHITKVA
jgi:peptidoglycan L-alanyl-D-glutamate endopeptidase CwlK